jgi:mannose-6-phosphate isomerase-like protein (cupin superfamily)
MLALVATYSIDVTPPVHVPSLADGEERLVFDASSGCDRLELRLLRLGPEATLARDPGDREEILFALAGSGAVRLGDESHALDAEHGAYLRPGERYDLVAGPEGLDVAAVLVPEPEAAGRERAVTVGQADPRGATGSREYRLLVDPASGCRSATQFIGHIPPGRAPDHYHEYDEVVVVLEGEGVFHSGDVDEPIRPRSCIHLRRRQLHSLENTGDREMRVLGVFRPAGSPAEAYYTDGTLAYVEPT